MLRRTFAVAAGLLVLGGCSQGRGSSPAPGARPLLAAPAAQGDAVPRIVVRGTGRVEGTPDVLTVQLGVQTRAPRAADALRANNEKAAGLVNVLKGRGVAARDIQTSALSLNPEFDDKGRVITGYVVDNVVTARLRDLSGAGALVDAAAQAAGDAIRVQSVAFSIDDTSALVAEARKQAVTRARAQAAQLAEAAGVKLGSVRSVTESPSSVPPPVRYDVAGAPGAPASVPIEAGSQTLVIEVEVVYDIAG